MSNDLSIKDYELINDMLLVSFTDNTEAVVSYEKLRKMCPCASCAGETDALGNLYKSTPKELSKSSFFLLLGVRKYQKDSVKLETKLFLV